MKFLPKTLWVNSEEFVPAAKPRWTKTEARIKEIPDRKRITSINAMELTTSTERS